MAWTEVVVGYLIVGSVTVLIVFRSYPEFFKKNLAFLFDKPTVKQIVPTESKKPAKSNAKPKTNASAKAPEPAVPVPDNTTSEAIVEEEGDDAVAFAQQLKKAQTGTTLKKADTPSEKPKKKKGKKNNKAEESTNVLTNGVQQAGEAVKDTVASLPSLPEAVQDTAGSFASGAAGMVSDIGTKVADTIRIREEYVPPPVPREDEWTSIPTKGQKTQQKVAKQEETKKQRQRAAARERERESVIQAEELRRKKMEVQLRTARIARGEPARNGEVSNFREGPAPSRSAWSTSGQPTSQDQTTGQYSGMLDTVDNPADVTSVEPRTPVIISDEDDDVYTNGTDAKSVPPLNGNA